MNQWLRDASFYAEKNVVISDKFLKKLHDVAIIPNCLSIAQLFPVSRVNISRYFFVHFRTYSQPINAMMRV